MTTKCNIDSIWFDDGYGMYNLRVGQRGGLVLGLATGEDRRIKPTDPNYAKLKDLVERMRTELGEFMDTQTFCRHGAP